jgi:hypothetical protein
MVVFCDDVLWRVVGGSCFGEGGTFNFRKYHDIFTS